MPDVKRKTLAKILRQRQWMAALTPLFSMLMAWVVLGLPRPVLALLVEGRSSLLLLAALVGAIHPLREFWVTRQLRAFLADPEKQGTPVPEALWERALVRGRQWPAFLLLASLVLTKILAPGTPTAPEALDLPMLSLEDFKQETEAERLYRQFDLAAPRQYRYEAKGKDAWLQVQVILSQEGLAKALYDGALEALPLEDGWRLIEGPASLHPEACSLGFGAERMEHRGLERAGKRLDRIRGQRGALLLQLDVQGAPSRQWAIDQANKVFNHWAKEELREHPTATTVLKKGRPP